MTTFNRELKSLNNKTGKKIVSELNIIIDEHEKYKNCYNWTVKGNAAGRRSQEFENILSFILNDKEVPNALNLPINKDDKLEIRYENT